jgi:hypothetical protein
MIDQTIKHELLFMRCENWNTRACPSQKNAVMGLTVINQDHLFLLSDETVTRLKEICSACSAFNKKFAKPVV